METRLRARTPFAYASVPRPLLNRALVSSLAVAVLCVPVELRPASPSVAHLLGDAFRQAAAAVGSTWLPPALIAATVCVLFVGVAAHEASHAVVALAVGATPALRLDDGSPATVFRDQGMTRRDLLAVALAPLPLGVVLGVVFLALASPLARVLDACLLVTTVTLMGTRRGDLHLAWSLVRLPPGSRLEFDAAGALFVRRPA